jgi:imidazolonepropionase-like amidohydrolase
MHMFKFLMFSGVVAFLVPNAAFSQLPNPSRAVLYEGARLIRGDDSAPIESGAFVVENGRISALGQKGAVKAPANATRVDLTGKTVIPALIDLHSHIGYERYTHEGGESRPENFTPENILDHLQRFAFYGVGTVNDAGSASLPVALQFLLDTEARKYPPAAQLVLMAGVVPPNGGPDHVLREGTRPLHANYEVTRAPEARAAVQDIAAKKVKQIKIWLGDRGGDYPAMPHEVYDAVIDEAHKLGIKVHVHAANSRDQKDALRAGVDLLVHGPVQVDDELATLVKEKKPYWAPVFGLVSDRSELCDSDPWVEQMYPPELITNLRTAPRPGVHYFYPTIGNCKPSPSVPNSPAGALRMNQPRNFMKMLESGARLTLGTDTGVFPSYSFGWADHHEIRKYVLSGLTPAQAIVAATSRPAEALGLTDVGTLAAGKRADFVVLMANPLDDINNTRKIDSVYLLGAKLDRAAILAKWKASATK